jgi:PAS domain-containing protein
MGRQTVSPGVLQGTVTLPYRSVTHDGVSLLCFPPHDLVFAASAARWLEGLERRDPEQLQAALQQAYPNAVVRARDPLASLGTGVAWYAYRDGRYSPFTESDPWWEQPSTAALIIAADGRYADANEAALALIGVDLETLRTMATGDLTDPAVRPTVPWIWALLEDAGSLHSTSILVTPDGRRVPVEYRIVLGADGEGRSVSYLREVPLEAATVAPADATTQPVPHRDP